MSDDKRIVIDAKGITIIGKWRIGELLSAAQSLAALVNDFEITGQAPVDQGDQAGAAV